jgi:hypothetical protein
VICGGSPCRLLGQDDLARSAPKVPTSTSMEPNNAVIVLPFVVFTLFHSLNKDIMGVAGVTTDFAQIMSGTYLLTYLGICHHVHTPAEHHTHPNHVHFSDHQIHIELTRISGSQSSCRYNSDDLWRRSYSATLPRNVELGYVSRQNKTEK